MLNCYLIEIMGDTIVSDKIGPPEIYLGSRLTRSNEQLFNHDFSVNFESDADVADADVLQKEKSWSCDCLNVGPTIRSLGAGIYETLSKYKIYIVYAFALCFLFMFFIGLFLTKMKKKTGVILIEVSIFVPIVLGLLFVVALVFKKVWHSWQERNSNVVQTL